MNKQIQMVNNPTNTDIYIYSTYIIANTYWYVYMHMLIPMYIHIYVYRIKNNYLYIYISYLYIYIIYIYISDIHTIKRMIPHINLIQML